MTYEELKKSSRIYGPALLFVGVLSPDVLHKVCKIVGVAALMSAGAMILTAIPSFGLTHYELVFQSCFYFALAVWLLGALFIAFFNSYYFLDVQTILPERGMPGDSVPLTFAVAEVLRETTSGGDAAVGLFISRIGAELLVRLGLSIDEIGGFLRNRKNGVSAETLVFPDRETITFPAYVRALLAKDDELKQFLFARAISQEDVVGAATWIAQREEERKAAARRWGRDYLGRMPGIGVAWGYGQIYGLRRFARELTAEREGEAVSSGASLQTDQLETILAREHGANAMIVADPGSGEMEPVYGLVARIARGTALSPLEHARCFSLDVNTLSTTFADMIAFERGCARIFSEAARAGNIILIFENFPQFIENARSIGADAVSVLAPYLGSTRLQIIAIANREYFHEKIESNAALTSAFEILRLATKDETALIVHLEHAALGVEARTGVRFTYQALRTIAQSVERFFAGNSPQDKAQDLLEELPVAGARAGRRVITEADVHTLVAAKTGVPQEGAIRPEEKEKLLNLEAILHQRIVGQDEAITAIAGAMRRARTGLGNPNRPIGSFLFLGPTGVGKTETAKALAEAFFGSEAPMQRLDMSEYASADALDRLIGSFQSGHPGVLSSMLREHQYGVLLLDEFEKTTTDVMNLFLRVLDEGIFSDMRGTPVNARNLIIIATSNAGSSAIFELARQGKDLQQGKDALVSSLIAASIFSPELINRFDGVIIFHPLGPENLRKIAALMVGRLGTRLKEQGYALTVTSDLIEFLVREGYDPKFGAREMNRVLAERVEKLLTDALIRGTVAKGATISFAAMPDGGLELRTQ